MEAIAAKRYEEALRLVDVLLGTEKTNPALWTLRGVVLGELRRDDDSLASFRQALRLDPAFVPALERATEIEFRRKDPALKSSLDRILAVRPEDSTAHLMSGVIAYRARDCHAALAHFARAGTRTGQTPAALAQQGHCQFELGRPAEAAASFRRLLQLRPADRTARFNLGLSLHEAGNHNEAAGAIAPLGETDAGALRLLATVWESSGEVQKAVDTLLKAIAVQPEDEGSYLHLAALCLARDSAALGIKVLAGGLDLVPSPGRLHAARGMLYAHLGQFEEAERDFRDADPASGAMGLAATRRVQGRASEAVALLGRSSSPL
jgi:tetratricopeptide (TPR) repeat protein